MQRLLSLLYLALPFAGSAQVLRNNGASIVVTSGTTLTVNGDFTNATGSTMGNNGTLKITGSITNNGSITTGSLASLNLAGSTVQNMSGTAAIAVKNVTVNNAAGITLTTPLQIDGAITFTSGILTAAGNSSPVIFTANGSVSGTPTDASHIDGYAHKLGTGAFTFPVGNATKYQPVGMNLSANSAGMTARYYNVNAGAASFGTSGSSATPLVAYNKREYWDLVPTGAASGTVTIYFDGFNNVGIGSTADLRVAHRSGGQWLNEGGTATGTITLGSVTSNSISTFSPFTLGSISNTSPLPVELLIFTAKAQGSENLLNWNTATETEGISFEVTRSGNGSNFEKLATVAGKGKPYSFYDEAPLAGVNYYRLDIVEPSGERIQSTIAIVKRNGLTGGIAVWPVPAKDFVTITNNNASLNGSTVVALDMQGRVVATAVVSVVTKMNVENLPAGIYILRFEDGTVVKLVKE